MASKHQDPLSQLEALAKETEDLSPSDDFSSALLASIEAKAKAEPATLSRLAEQTNSLAPSEGFSDAVMERIKGVRPENAWLEGVGRIGRFALLGAAAAAAISLFLASRAESGFDSTVLESIAVVEVGEE